MNYRYNLLCNVHSSLPLPNDAEEYAVTKGKYKYFHYGCDSVDDRGWGCGYRTLMTLCSWIQNEGHGKNVTIPSIYDIQRILVEINDKEREFINSKQWIGTFEACLILDALYDIPSKIIHISSGKEIINHTDTLLKHFTTYGSPIMMGGNTDNSSKGIMGICRGRKESYLLVIDPHFWGSLSSPSRLHNEKWVTWTPVNEFQELSFYNICLPQKLSG